MLACVKLSDTMTHCKKLNTSPIITQRREEETRRRRGVIGGQKLTGMSEEGVDSTSTSCTGMQETRMTRTQRKMTACLGKTVCLGRT